MSDPYDEQAVPYQPVDDQNAYTAPTYNATTTATKMPAPDADTAFAGGHNAAYTYAPVSPQHSSRGLRTGAIFALTLLLAAVFCTGLFAGWEYGRGTVGAASQNTGATATAPAPSATLPPLTGNSNADAQREAVVARVRPAVVQVNVTTSNGSGIGSGVLIDKRGYIVTNNHVVAGAQDIKVVLYNGTSVTAQLVGTDPADDLAVIKITPPASGLTVASIGDSSKLVVGQEVLAIGNPLGITQTVTNGIVSALGRNVNEQNGTIIPDAIQTDASINPGNSGGALVNMQGNLVGIPTLSAIDPEFNTPANGVGFAIPSNRVQFITAQIIANGKVIHTGRAALGVNVESVDANLAVQDNLSIDHGALIVNVTPDGPAARANLQAGDVIVQVDNTAVNDISSLGDALLSKNPGDTVSVKVYRGNQQLTVSVTLGELQAG